jgi:hydrogenase/urease accessory protein HupE
MSVVFNAQAHDPGLSAVALQLGPRQLQADLSMALGDVKLLVPTLEADGTGRVAQTSLAAAMPQLQDFTASAFEVEWNGHRVLPTGLRIQANDSRAIHFQMSFPREVAAKLTVRSTLIPRLGRGHRQYVALHDDRGALLGEQMLDATRNVFEQNCENAPAAVSEAPSFRQFLALGVRHILTGYDHICFLLGLLIAGGSLREVLKIITAFTVAHSITLALATMNVLNIPPRIIEPLIAVSIIYVGIENVLRRDLRRRWLLSFGFGLVHGCGFASALRELGIGSGGSGIIVPLVSFNLGVELGQVAIAALVLPLIWQLKNQPAFTLRYAPACSVIVSLAGSYWLIQRIWWN